MKITIFVNYSSKEFNKDFNLANMLISKGHNVFLAINDNQFNELKIQCDRVFLGYSYSGDNNNTPKISETYDL